jgi:hypothetical protein
MNITTLKRIAQYIENTRLSDVAGKDLNDFNTGAEYDFECAHDAEHDMIDAVIEMAKERPIVKEERGYTLLVKIACTDEEEIDIMEGDWLFGVYADIELVLNEVAR